MKLYVIFRTGFQNLENQSKKISLYYIYECLFFVSRFCNGGGVWHAMKTENAQNCFFFLYFSLLRFWFEVVKLEISASRSEIWWWYLKRFFAGPWSWDFSIMSQLEKSLNLFVQFCGFLFRLRLLFCFIYPLLKEESDHFFTV